MKLSLLMFCIFVPTDTVSPLFCPLEGCYKCNPVPSCKCGTYKDYCGCCDYCYKCPDESCHLLARERCTKGYKCQSISGLAPHFDPDGKCVPENQGE